VLNKCGCDSSENGYGITGAQSVAEFEQFPWGVGGANGFIGQNFDVLGQNWRGKWAKFHWIIKEMSMGWEGGLTPS
jgi:hypothetical protein